MRTAPGNGEEVRKWIRTDAYINKLSACQPQWNSAILPADCVGWDTLTSECSSLEERRNASGSGLNEDRRDASKQKP